MKKPLANTPARLQRMLLRLQRYDIDVIYKSGKEMVFADALSRAHIMEESEEILEEELNAQVHMVYKNGTASDEMMNVIQIATDEDQVLKILKEYIVEGWPNSNRITCGEVASYCSYQEELSILNGIIYK